MLIKYRLSDKRGDDMERLFDHAFSSSLCWKT